MAYNDPNKLTKFKSSGKKIAPQSAYTSLIDKRLKDPTPKDLPLKYGELYRKNSSGILCRVQKAETACSVETLSGILDCRKGDWIITYATKFKTVFQTALQRDGVFQTLYTLVSDGTYTEELPDAPD